MDPAREAMQFEDDFKKYLIENGFPEEAIVYEPRFREPATSSLYRPDFAIIDPKTKDTLAVIEVKLTSDKDRISNRIKPQIKKFNEIFRDTNVKSILVQKVRGEEGFMFYALNNNSEFEEISQDVAFTFTGILNTSTVEKISNINRDREDTRNTFNKVCYSFIVFIFLSVASDFILSFYGITLLTAERITAFGVAVVLAIFPFAQKLKFLGIEFERYTGKIDKG